MAVFLLSFWGLGTGYAYVDQVNVKAEEVWAAAQEVLKTYGFKKVDAQARRLETKWITDRVVRSRGLLKKYASKTYERRYQIIVTVQQRDYDSEVSVRGVFQERPLENKQQLYLWKKYKPESADYDIERQTFMSILNRLELSRNGS